MVDAWRGGLIEFNYNYVYNRSFMENDLYLITPGVPIFLFSEDVICMDISALNLVVKNTPLLNSI